MADPDPATNTNAPVETGQPDPSPNPPDGGTTTAGASNPPTYSNIEWYNLRTERLRLAGVFVPPPPELGLNSKGEPIRYTAEQWTNLELASLENGAARRPDDWLYHPEASPGRFGVSGAPDPDYRHLPGDPRGFGPLTGPPSPSFAALMANAKLYDLYGGKYWGHAIPTDGLTGAADNPWSYNADGTSNLKPNMPGTYGPGWKGYPGDKQPSDTATSANVSPPPVTNSPPYQDNTKLSWDRIGVLNPPVDADTLNGMELIRLNRPATAVTTAMGDPNGPMVNLLARDETIGAPPFLPSGRPITSLRASLRLENAAAVGAPQTTATAGGGNEIATNDATRRAKLAPFNQA